MVEAFKLNNNSTQDSSISIHQDNLKLFYHCKKVDTEMGMDSNTARFLISAYEDGLRFDRTLTLGKQTLYVNEEGLKTVQKSLACAVPNQAVALTPLGSAELVLQALGAEKIDSMDRSDFEGATLLHDLNIPIQESHKEQFDVVYDGGTLEHIFNFPVAIKNIMEMVKVGGHLAIQTPTNNWSGHGFYQFSPELYFRVLSEENGFRVKRMVVFEWGINQWYEVADPAIVRSRVYVVNSCRTSLLILAERLAVKAINEDSPQQSDYALSKWTADSAPQPQMVAATTAMPQKPLKKALLKVGMPILQTIASLKQGSAQQTRNFFLQNRSFFTPVDR